MFITSNLFSLYMLCIYIICYIYTNFAYFLRNVAKNTITTRLLFKISYILNLTLREKCPNTEFFLVRIFPHLDWIRRDTKYLSVFSLNAGKCGPEKLRIWIHFTQCYESSTDCDKKCKKVYITRIITKWKEQ